MNIDLLNQVIEILSRYPLCDRCLGRLYANLATGLSNTDRGSALKTATAMYIHTLILSGKEEYVDVLKKLASNAGEPFIKLFRKFSNEDLSISKVCYICKGGFNDLVKEYIDKVLKILNSFNVKTFLIGCRDPVEMEGAQQEIIERFRLEYWEKIKEELKREIGKSIMASTSYRASYEDPDIVVEIDPNVGSAIAVFPSEFYLARLKKFSREIYIGSREYYQRSIEGLINNNALDHFESDYISIKPSVRIYKDYRVVGSGVTVSIEIHNPRHRYYNANIIEDLLNVDRNIFILKLRSRVKRRSIGEVSEYVRRVIYRVLLYIEPECSKDLSDSEIASKLSSIDKEVISQKTPSRLLKWKYDYTKYGKAKVLDIYRVSTTLIEVVISIDKNLYIEELLSGDKSRTKPSFASLLECPVVPLKIDIIGVSH